MVIMIFSTFIFFCILNEQFGKINSQFLLLYLYALSIITIGGEPWLNIKINKLHWIEINLWELKNMKIGNYPPPIVPIPPVAKLRRCLTSFLSVSSFKLPKKLLSIKVNISTSSLTPRPSIILSLSIDPTSPKLTFKSTSLSGLKTGSFVNKTSKTKSSSESKKNSLFQALPNRTILSWTKALTIHCLQPTTNS